MASVLVGLIALNMSWRLCDDVLRSFSILSALKGGGKGMTPIFLISLYHIWAARSPTRLLCRGLRSCCGGSVASGNPRLLVRESATRLVYDVRRVSIWYPHGYQATVEANDGVCPAVAKTLKPITKEDAGGKKNRGRGEEVDVMHRTEVQL